MCFVQIGHIWNITFIIVSMEGIRATMGLVEFSIFANMHCKVSHDYISMSYTLMILRNHWNNSSFIFGHLSILIWMTNLKIFNASFLKTSISDLTQCCTEPLCPLPPSTWAVKSTLKPACTWQGFLFLKQNHRIYTRKYCLPYN